MDAERGPGPRRRVLGVAAPVGRGHLAEIAVADIGVHVQDAAERALLDQPAHLLHGRLEAALVADAEHAAGLGAGFQDAFRARGGQRQRLLAKHLLTGGETRDRHFLMQQVRRHHRDGVQRGIPQ